MRSQNFISSEFYRFVDVSVTRLGKGIRLIEGERGGRYPFSNSLLVNECLIDSGAGRVLEGLSFETVINSHWHEDHIAMNCRARKVMVHHLDSRAVEDFDEFKERYAIGDAIKLFVNFQFCEVDEVFDDGQNLDFGVEILPIHTPGHSVGHCCFLIDGRILFLGDIDLSFPWYGCLDCSVTDFLDSIEKIRKLADEVEIAVPGHGSVVRGDELASRLDNYKEIILERERRIKELLKSGKDPVGKGVIYRRLPEPVDVFRHFEKVMVEKHIERLRKKI
jgi:glyoxylase-like metal-dependent hydrolase (beta-lactamase superfamily II)